jgi:isopenicillin N synthase-like dioxygenase
MSDIVNVGNILRNDEKTIEKVKNNLKKRGWCFVKFSDLFKNNAKKVTKDIKRFFSLDSAIKEKYSYNYNIGYYNLTFKQHLKILTGNYNVPDLKQNSDTDTIGERDMKKALIELSNVMDNLMLKLTLSQIFGLKKEQMTNLSIFGDNKAGLLDIVSYKPNIDISDRPFYVSEHVDPGLFSLNIYSDASGMQFYDNENKKWYEMPPNCGVIFCGQAANTLLNYSPAIHRVVNNGIGRLSVWYEVGIKSQLQPKENIKRISNLFDNGRNGDEKKIKINVKIEEKSTNVPKYKSMFIPANGTVSDIKKRIELFGGAPMSKSVSISPSKSEEKSHYNYKNINLIENNDDAKIGNIRKWKITANGFLMPDKKIDNKSASVGNKNFNINNTYNISNMRNNSSTRISYAPFESIPIDPKSISYVPKSERLNIGETEISKSNGKYNDLFGYMTNASVLRKV